MSDPIRFRPTFFLGQACIESIAAGFIGLITIGVGVQTLVAIIAGGFGSTHVVGLMFMFVPLSIIVPMIAYVLIKKANYRKTFYEFDDHHIVFFDGFLNTRRKEVMLKNILEVNYDQNFVQRMFGVGTITLNTAATGQTPSPANSGIKLQDLENPQNVFEKIRDIVHTKQA